jgi:hypothetical protein
MERQDEEAVLVDMEANDSDKEGIQYQRNGVILELASKYGVADARKAEWEYKKNHVLLGSNYPNLKAVNEAIKFWRISLRKEFQVVNCDSTVIKVSQWCASS